MSDEEILVHLLACSYIAEDIDGLLSEQIASATLGGVRVRGLEHYRERTAELCGRIDTVQRALLARRRIRLV